MPLENIKHRIVYLVSIVNEDIKCAIRMYFKLVAFQGTSHVEPMQDTECHLKIHKIKLYININLSHISELIKMEL